MQEVGSTLVAATVRMTYVDVVGAVECSARYPPLEILSVTTVAAEETVCLPILGQRGSVDSAVWVVGLSFGVFGSMWVGCLMCLVRVGVVRRLVRRGC